MNFEHKIIFKALVGSQAYGTATPSSDQDYKGVYVQNRPDILTFNYVQQYEVSKDETYYEVRRFIELLRSANPTVLEMLYSPQDCILFQTPAFNPLLQHRDRFLTKRCQFTFANYAATQIKKAKGTDKLMNWESSRMERKDVLDFCYIYEDGKTIPLKPWLDEGGMKQEYCGLVALDHFRDGYALYYDSISSMTEDARMKHLIFDEPLGYRGIAGDDSNEVRLSSVPKGQEPVAIMTFNKDGYSVHCKDYGRYLEWKEKHNRARLVDVKNHNQKIDGKNMLHCRRLLDVAYEIATEHTINVRRPNADELLKIRRGEVDLQTLIHTAEDMIEKMGEVYAESNLPEDVDIEFCNDLIMEIRDRSQIHHMV